MATTKKNNNQVRVSHNLGGKMKGIPAITTSCIGNAFCEKMHNCANKGKVICADCYAFKGLGLWKQAREMYAANTEKMTKRILKPSEMPISEIAGAPVCRFNSHSELHNLTELRNIYAIIENVNIFCECFGIPQTMFALWTKRKSLIEKAAKMGFLPPENLSIVYSCFQINPDKEIAKQYKPGKDIVKPDFIFAVYRTENDRKNAGGFQCQLNCNHCRHCYRKTDKPGLVCEILKK